MATAKTVRSTVLLPEPVHRQGQAVAAVLLQSFDGDETAAGIDHPQAATSNSTFTKAVWATMSSLLIPFTCPFLIISSVS
mgnify:CR=1 FL=1